jgi:hypothetical protein
VVVVCCLVHSARQDHLLTVSLSSVAMGCMESCKVHCADVLKARVLQFVLRTLDRRLQFENMCLGVGSLCPRHCTEGQGLAVCP